MRYLFTFLLAASLTSCFVSKDPTQYKYITVTLTEIKHRMVLDPQERVWQKQWRYVYTGEGLEIILPSALNNNETIGSKHQFPIQQ